MPAFLRFTPDILYGDVPSEHIYELRANAHLEFLHNDFLIYRLLEKRTGSISDELVCSAREALSLMLAMLSRQLRRKSSGTHVNAWNVCAILSDTRSEAYMF